MSHERKVARRRPADNTDDAASGASTASDHGAGSEYFPDSDTDSEARSDLGSSADVVFDGLGADMRDGFCSESDTERAESTFGSDDDALAASTAGGCFSYPGTTADWETDPCSTHADLYERLRRFYKVNAPCKLYDPRLDLDRLAREYTGYETALNARLFKRYRVDLTSLGTCAYPS